MAVGGLSSAMANVPNSDIIENEFELQSRYHVHFRTKMFGKVMKPLILQLWVK